MKPLRVCFVLPKIPVADNGAVVGGSTNSALGLAITLARSGVNLEIIAPLSDQENKALQKHPIYPYIHMVTLNIQSRTRGALYRLWKLNREVACAHRNKSYDIIHIHSGSILYGNVFTGLENSPVKLHSVYCPVINNKRNVMIQFSQIILANLVSCQTDSYIGMTTSIFKNIQNCLIDKGKAIELPMSVDVNSFQPIVQQTRFLGQESSSSIIRLLFVGNTSTEKGLDILIDALISLIKQNIKIELIATIENRSNIQIYETRRLKIIDKIKSWGLNDNVRLLSESENIADLIYQTDAVVIPFQDTKEAVRISGYPMILLEAMACGKCVVATPIEGVLEIVKHDRNGILSTAFDAESLSAAIQNIVKSPEKRAALGAEAKCTIDKTYSTLRIASKMKKIYSKLLLNKQGI